MKIIFWLSLTILILFRSLQAKSDQLELRLETYLDGISRFGFSGAVIIADANHIIFYKPYGLADRKTGRKITSHTIFTTGSITKLFTALLIMKLAARHLLDLDDPISLFIPSVPVDKKKITIRNLLMHTSGLKRNGLEGGDTNLNATREAVLENICKSDLLFTPGSVQSYSNIAYTLLAIIAENICGLPYEELLYIELFKPAGMFQTGYLIPAYKDVDLAKGYKGDKEIDALIRLPKLADGLTWNVRGNGGIHTNLFDMYRFYLSLRGGDFLTLTILESMFEKPALDISSDKYYGIGFEIEREDSLLDISHSGGNGYFSADFHWLIHEGKMFYLSCNDGEINIGQISENIQKIIRDKEIPMPPQVIPLPADSLIIYTGCYVLDDGDTITVNLDENNLKLNASSEQGIKMIFGIQSDDSDSTLIKLRQKSKNILCQEFKGDFNQKFIAMKKHTSLESLKRYHQYDAAYWDKQFGIFKNVQILGSYGSYEFLLVLLKINFNKGAAAEVYTWKKGVLVNISVYPDLRQFDLTRILYPLSHQIFQSYQINSPVISKAEFLFLNSQNNPDTLIVNGYQAVRLK